VPKEEGSLLINEERRRKISVAGVATSAVMGTRGRRAKTADGRHRTG